MGLLAGDVLEGFGEKLHPTGWPLERAQDFNSREVDGVEAVSCEGKGSGGGWRIEGVPPSGKSSCVWLTQEQFFQGFAEPLAFQAEEDGELKLANSSFLQTWKGRGHQCRKGIRAAQDRDPHLPVSPSSGGMSS